MIQLSLDGRTFSSSQTIKLCHFYLHASLFSLTIFFTPRDHMSYFDWDRPFLKLPVQCLNKYLLKHKNVQVLTNTISMHHACNTFACKPYSSCPNCRTALNRKTPTMDPKCKLCLVFVCGYCLARLSHSHRALWCLKGGRRPMASRLLLESAARWICCALHTLQVWISWKSRRLKSSQTEQTKEVQTGLEVAGNKKIWGRSTWLIRPTRLLSFCALEDVRLEDQARKTTGNMVSLELSDRKVFT